MNRSEFGEAKVELTPAAITKAIDNNTTMKHFLII
jgi:hypothetical protein